VQVRKLKRLVSLQELKGMRESNAVARGLQLFTMARLSIQNMSQAEWDLVLALEEQPVE
jgi:predicted RNA-binding protein with PUA-like domain